MFILPTLLSELNWLQILCYRFLVRFLPSIGCESAPHYLGPAFGGTLGLPGWQDLLHINEARIARNSV